MANESIKFLKSILDVTIRIEKRMEREEKKKDQITSGMVGGVATIKTKETGNLDKYVNLIASGLQKFEKLDKTTTKTFISFIGDFYKSIEKTSIDNFANSQLLDFNNLINNFKYLEANRETLTEISSSIVMFLQNFKHEISDLDFNDDQVKLDNLTDLIKNINSLSSTFKIEPIDQVEMANLVNLVEQLNSVSLILKIKPIDQVEMDNLVNLVKQLNSLSTSFKIESIDQKEIENLTELYKNINSFSINLPSIDQSKVENLTELFKHINSLSSTFKKIEEFDVESSKNFINFVETFYKTLSKIPVDETGSAFYLREQIHKVIDTLDYVETRQADIERISEGFVATLSKYRSALQELSIDPDDVESIDVQIRRIVGTFEYLIERQEEIDAALDTMGLMSKGIISLAKGLAIAAPLLLLTIPLIPIIGVALMGLGIVFSIIGLGSPLIILGAWSVNFIGMSLRSLAIGFFLMAASLWAVQKLFRGDVYSELPAFLLKMGMVYGAIGAMYMVIFKGLRVVYKMGSGLTLFGLGIMTFALSMALVAKFLKTPPIETLIAIGTMLGVLAGTFVALGLASPWILKGTRSLYAMGSSLLIFSAGLLVFLLASKFVDFHDVIKMMGIIVAIGMTYGALGKIPGITKGTLAITAIGVSLMVFSVGLFLFSLTLKLLQPADLIKMILFSGTTIAIYALAGSFAGLIGMGSLAMSAIGLSLFVFGFGLASVSGALKLASWEGLFMLSGYLLILSGIYSMLGLTIFLTLPGAIVVAAIGASLVPLAAGLLAITGVISLVNWSDLGFLAVAILGLGFVYTMVGLALFFPLIGAISVAAIGASLIPFSLGLLTIAGPISMIGFKDLLKIGLLIAGLGIEFAAIGLISPLIMLGTAGVASIGIGIQEMARGITLMKDVDLSTFKGKEFKEILLDLAGAFSALGDEGGKEPSLMSSLIGVDFGKTPIERGIYMAAGIGRALSSVAEGLNVFGNLTKIPRITGYDKKGNPILDYRHTTDLEDVVANIEMVFGTGEKFSILDPFIEFSKVASDDSGWSIASFVTGNDFGRTSLQRGISSAMEIGNALSSIGEGLSVFGNLQNIPKIVGYKNGKPQYKGHVDLEKAIGHIRDVFGLGEDKEMNIIAPFAEFSKHATNSKPASLLSWMYGGDFGTTPLQRGVSTAIEIGRALSSIGQGIGVFADLQAIPVITGYKNGNPIYGDTPVDIEDAILHIQEVLDTTEGSTTSILNPFVKFSKIAAKDKPFSIIDMTFGTSIAKTPFQIGVVAAATIGIALQGIATGITSFANLSKIPIMSGYDKKTGQYKYSGETVDLKDAIANIQEALIGEDGNTGLIGVFSTVASKVDKDKITQIRLFSRLIVTMTKGYEDLDNFATAMDKMATSMGVFVKSIDDLNIDKFDKFANWSLSMAEHDPNSFEKVVNEVMNSTIKFVKGMGDYAVDIFDGDKKEPEIQENVVIANNDKSNDGVLSELNLVKEEIKRLSTIITTGIDVNVTNTILKIEEGF